MYVTRLSNFAIPIAGPNPTQVSPSPYAYPCGHLSGALLRLLRTACSSRTVILRFLPCFSLTC